MAEGAAPLLLPGTRDDQAKSNREEKILDFYLEEYKQSRNEMTIYNNRVDRIIIAYISAVITIFGFVLAVKDTSGDVAQKLESLLDLIQGNPSVKVIVFVITMLQAFLVLLVTGYTMTVYRHAKYTSTYLRRRVNDLLEVRREDEDRLGILHFDLTRDVETRVVNSLRGCISVLWYVLLLLLNVLLVAWLCVDWTHSVACWVAVVASILLNAIAVGASAIQAFYWKDDNFDRHTFPENPGATSWTKIPLRTIDGANCSGGQMRSPRVVFVSAATITIVVYLGAIFALRVSYASENALRTAAPRALPVSDVSASGLDAAATAHD